MGCVVYGIQFCWGGRGCGLVCSTSFGFSSGSQWGFFDLRLSLCVSARARGLAHLVYIQERKNILTCERM